jgi:branched-chain amino acid transport system ATP-binding protein
MGEALLAVTELSKSFGGVVATDGLTLGVGTGEIHAVIGPNGAGKTTLIAQLSGMLRPDRGRIRFDGADITHLPAPQRARRGLARSFQITSILRDFTCLDNVALGVQARSGHSFRFWRPAGADPELRAPALTILEEVGLAHRAHIAAGNLAHGEQRQLEIAMVLATGPKMLLLDEPMAGMGTADSERMTEYLGSLKSRYTMLLVEHDMDAVFALADRITVLLYGRAIASGSPEEIRANDEVRAAYLGED